MFKMKAFIIKNKKGASFSTLLFIATIMLLSNNITVTSLPKQVGLTIFSTFQGMVVGIGDFFSNTIGSIRTLNNLTKQHEAALEQLEYYAGIERNLIELKQENQELKKLLDFSEEIQLPNVPAKVIGKDPSESFSGITINKGSQDGVKLDDPVIAFNQGFYGLVGKVHSVGLNSSIILPLFNSNTYVAARMQESRYEGLVHGILENDYLIQMEYVNKLGKGDIQYGDLVITSGMQSLYPKGIYIGRVRSVEDLNYESSLRLTLEPIVNFSILEYVFILKKEGSSQ